MKISKLKNRSIVFTKNLAGWDLHIQLIRANKYNYLIDTGLGPLMMKEIIAYLKDDDKELIIINTHYHFDHILGNSAFKDNIIVSSALTKSKLDKDWQTIISGKDNYFDGSIEKVLPNKTFIKELYFSEDKIRLFISPRAYS